MDVLLTYGERRRHRGAEVSFMDKRSRSTVRRELGPEVYARMADRLDAYLVVADDGEVVTAAKRLVRLKLSMPEPSQTPTAADFELLRLCEETGRRGLARLPPGAAIGFTGTRRGCTEEQLAVLRSLMRLLAPAEWRHGDCVGADAQSHELAAELGLKIVIHPPVREDARAFMSGGKLRAPASYLNRNRAIVRETDGLVACPWQPFDTGTLEEHLRSREGGTWYTTRFACRRGKPVWIVFPAGEVVLLNARSWRQLVNPSAELPASPRSGMTESVAPPPYISAGNGGDAGMPDGMDFLKSLRVGRPSAVENLTAFPLLGDDGSANFLTLDEALAQELVTVTEVSEGGSVPELRLENRAERPVLILDGEELIGAKQNRILNTSVLAPAGRSIAIPVSCVEQGRWSWSSRRFGASNRVQFASGRAAKMDHVRRQMETGRGRSADQGAVWDGIAAKSERLRVHSATLAMSDVYEAYEDRLAAFVDRLPSTPGQIGVAFARGRKIVSVEVVANQAAFPQLYAKLVRSQALDAIEWAKADGACAVDHVERYLASLSRAAGGWRPGVGAGEELRFELDGASGLALRHEGQVVHFVAFRATASAQAC